MKVQIQVSCLVRYDAESDTFVSKCPELNMLSAGNTILEAQEAMRSAITMRLQWTLKLRPHQIQCV